MRDRGVTNRGQEIETKRHIYCRDPNYSGSGKCFQELISEKSLTLLPDRPRLELIIVSSNFQALLFLQDKLLESVWQLLIPVKHS